MTTDTLKQAELIQVKNLEEKYGKSIAEWKTILQQSKLVKHGEMVSFLKDKHAMTHGYANMLVHLANQSHAGAVENQDVLITDQYTGKETLKPWYDQIIDKIKSFGNDVELSPKKAYVSVRRKKQFAIIQPSTKTRLDVGINLKDTAPTGNLEASGSWNTMCTHRIKIEQENDVNQQVFDWLQKAYDQAR